VPTVAYLAGRVASPVRETTSAKSARAPGQQTRAALPVMEKPAANSHVEQLIVVEPVSSHLPAAVVESHAKAKVPELKPVADALLVGNTSGRWRPLTVVWLRSLAKFSHGKDYRHY